MSNDMIKLKLLRKKGYNNGSIIRVRMMNFLTYDDCEVFPGPKLNVVIGPNGAGKSTLTHAICLACGGSPQHVGRSPELKQFVKRDKVDMECYIEIDILDYTSTSNGAIHTIRRTISGSKNSSVWYFDNKKTNEVVIKEFLKTFKIDVSNLCSFMPQDKVGSFSRKTPKELLQDTLKSIALNENKTLYDEQLQLSNYENEKADKLKTKESKELLIQQIETELADLKGEVDRIQLRNESLKKINYYNIKKIIVNALTIDNEIKQLNSEKDDIEKELNINSCILEPLENNERDVKRLLSNFNNDINNNKSNLLKLNNKLNELKELCNSIDINIDSISKEIELIDQIKEKQIIKLNELTIEKNKLEEQLAISNNSIPNIKNELMNNNNQLNELNQLEENINNDIHQSKLLLDQNQKNLNNLNKLVNNLQDEKQIFKNKIEKLNISINKNDLFHALEFISNNKSRFESNVYGPIALEISVSNPACAIMLEKAIPMKQLLMTFITLNDHDSSILKNELVNRSNIRIDVITMSNITEMKRPYPIEIVNQHQNIGLKGFLIDQIKCDEVIKCYLSMFINLHSVLFAVFNKSNGVITDKDIQSLSTDQGLRLYVHYITNNTANSTNNYDIVEYNGTKSRYGDRVLSLADTAVTNTKGIISSDNNNDNDVETTRNNFINQINKIKSTITDISNDINNKRIELDKIITTTNNININKQLLNKSLRLPNEITNKLQLVNNNINNLSKQINKDVQLDKQNKINDYIELINQFVNITINISNISNEIIRLNVYIHSNNEVKNNLSNQLNIIQANILNSKQLLNNIIKKLNNKKLEIEKINSLRTNYLNELEKLRQTYNSEEQFDELLSEIESVCPESTIDEINEQISTIELNIKRIIDNPQVIIRYEELNKQLNIEKDLLIDINNLYNQSYEFFINNTKNWFDRVTNVIHKLDIKFSEYMRNLNYYGNVKLVEKGKLIDYEIQLNVSFRNESDLVELSGLRHSGGERAVSTIMYLMALQDMTASPFRVVDEINQGMDERNERLVLDRIVQNCCTISPSGYNPQYFLVTPKLLPGLRSLENDNVTVLVIFNGPGAMIDMDISTIIKENVKKYSHLFDDIDIDSDIENDSSDDEIQIIEPVNTSNNKTIGRKRIYSPDDDE